MLNTRPDFPIFASNPKLVYLDSAATTQKPRQVIEAVDRFYRTSYASVHRGLYPLSQHSTDLYEDAREQIAAFIGARSSKEIIFTRSATESLNLLASSLSENWQIGDQVILSELEHHANLVPWQQVAKFKGLELLFLPVDETGEIDLTELPNLLTEKTKVISLSHCSNVLGTFTPADEVKKILLQEGSTALLIIDASQSVAHLPLSVNQLKADFMVFSSHKLYGPSGVGILWGRSELLENLPPYQSGGDMIQDVDFATSTWNTLPWKFEAGTPNIEGAIGLAASLQYLIRLDMNNVATHTAEVSTLLRDRLTEIPEITIIGDPSPLSGLVSFTVKYLHPHDIASLLGEKEICIRAGHHCAAPLHKKLNLPATNRASVGIYTTEQDVITLTKTLERIISDFQHV